MSDVEARVEAIVRLQALLADALTAADPVAFLRAQPDPPAIDADGLRMAALLIAKLRFERLMSASRRANEWFEQDAKAFTAAFRAYHLEVPPAALDPWREAMAFERWMTRSSSDETVR